MFQYREPTMKKVWATAFKILEKYYHQHNIPAIADVPLVKPLWLLSNKTTMEMSESVLGTYCTNRGQEPDLIGD